MRIIRKSFNNKFMNIFVLAILFVILITFTDYSYDKIPYIRLLALALICYHFTFLKINKIWFGDLAFSYTAANYLFIISYVFIWEHGCEKLLWNTGYSAELWIKAFLYGLCYIHAVFTGLLWSCRKKEFSEQFIESRNKSYNPKMIFAIGIILLIISMPCKFYVDALFIITNRGKGIYSSVLGKDQVNGIIFNLSLISNVALIYIIASKHLTKKTAILFFILFFTYGLGITTFTGGRRFIVTAFLASFPCLIYSYQIKIKLKDFIFICLAGYGGLVFLKTVSATRLLLASSITEYLSYAWEYIQNNNVFYDFLEEFGNTIYAYIIAFDCYPRILDFAHGRSLIFVWVLAIPGMGRLLPNLASSVSVSKYAQDNYNYWFGGALGQEMYCNFGFVAVWLSVGLGMLFKRFLGSTSERLPIATARYFSMSYILLNLVRSDLYEFTRLILWALLLPFFIHSILKRFKR